MKRFFHYSPLFFLFIFISLLICFGNDVFSYEDKLLLLNDYPSIAHHYGHKSHGNHHSRKLSQFQVRRPVKKGGMIISNESFAKTFETTMMQSPVQVKNHPDQTLRCEYDGINDHYRISSKIEVSITKIAKKGFYPTTICIYDYLGRCRTKPHLSVSSNVSYLCTFRMKDVIVTTKGAIQERGNGKPISYGHVTVAGGKDPQYAPVMAYMFLKGIDFAIEPPNTKALQLPENSILIPVRSRYDDCFNHQSFQVLPMISLTYEFHPDLFYSAYWHASLYTAAFLLLADVPESHIVVEKTVQPKEVVMPWIPYWNPMQLPPIYNVSRRLEVKITENLLKKSFPVNIVKQVAPLKLLDFQYHPYPKETIQKVLDSPEQRFIVYLNRSSEGERSVENEREILQILQNALNPQQYTLIVLGATKGYPDIIHNQIIWQQFARIINKAKVIIGPHGGGMNNVIWAPDDCELVEFNEFPDDDSYKQSHNQVPVRIPFLAAWWARGGKKYWNIAASVKMPYNFYIGRMRISPREILEVFAQIEGGNLLDKNYNISQHEHEKHTCWTTGYWRTYSLCT